MGKTTVEIDEELMREALRATNIRTKKEVIEKGRGNFFAQKIGSASGTSWVPFP